MSKKAEKQIDRGSSEGFKTYAFNESHDKTTPAQR